MKQIFAAAMLIVLAGCQQGNDDNIAIDETNTANAEIETLPPYVIRARGRIPEEPIDLTGIHPLKSYLVMLEDIYACEAVQQGLDSGAAEIGPLSRWEAPMTFFQRQLLDVMPVA